MAKTVSMEFTRFGFFLKVLKRVIYMVNSFPFIRGWLVYMGLRGPRVGGGAHPGRKIAHGYNMET